jgi:hypothetical protein
MATGCGGKPDGCIPLDPAVAQAVVNGATGNLQVRPHTGQAIKADSGVYYAAFRIDAAGSDEVGVWALSAIDPPGEIRSVDGFAEQFTSWPALDGANGSDAANDAKACLD